MIRTKAFLFSVVATFIFLPLVVIGYGLLLRTQDAPVNWTTLGSGFTIFVILIDVPLIGLALWFAQHTEESNTRLMNETLDRALTVATRLFIEHYQAEQRRGALPAVPLVDPHGQPLTISEPESERTP